MNSGTNTPLRYPGGKSILTEYFTEYINANNIASPIYAEPYCGGAGAAINLLINKRVDKIILNDADISIYAFWHTVVHRGTELIEKIRTTEIQLDEWMLQKSILTEGKKGKSKDLFQIGFATFFLNRCNRSGILTAGPIGGKSLLSQNEANYKIDARFKKEALIDKLKAIEKLSNQIEVHNLDAISFLENVINKQTQEEISNTFVYLDPPYYNQGSSLYLDYYKPEDHVALRDFIENEENQFRWLLSYDNVGMIKKLYTEYEKYTFYINYSAQQSKLGSELLIPSKNSIIPESRIIRKLKNKKKIELIPVN